MSPEQLRRSWCLPLLPAGDHSELQMHVGIEVKGHGARAPNPQKRPPL